jgi:hypothetical protein
MRTDYHFNNLRKIVAVVALSSVWMLGAGCVGSTEPTASASFASVVVSTSSLPFGTLGMIYSAALAASGGSAPYQWSVSDGSLPKGLALVAGAVVGTPSAPGTSAFTVQVHDSKKRSARANLAITISASGSTAPAITTNSLPGGTVGTPYSASLAASGGTAPYQWSVNGGSLPKGLILDANSGAITGTPSSSGTSAFTVQVQDSKGHILSANLAITISATDVSTPAIMTKSLLGGTAGTPY